MAQSTPEETTRLLTRLAQKPGVSSTLILSRSTGAVVRASGLISRDVSAPDANGANGNTSPEVTLPANDAQQAERDTALNGTDSKQGKKKNGTRDAEEVAKLVWNFFKNAGGTVEGMFGAGEDGEGEDEVKLIRLRARKNEVVVVPDAKFLLCVIHDTPPA